MACKNCWGCLGIYSGGSRREQLAAWWNTLSRALSPWAPLVDEHFWAKTPLPTPYLASSCSTACLCWNTTGNCSLGVLTPDLWVLQGDGSHAPGLNGKEMLTGSCMAESEAGPASQHTLGHVNFTAVLTLEKQNYFWLHQGQKLWFHLLTKSQCRLWWGRECGPGEPSEGHPCTPTLDPWGGCLLSLGALE